MAIKVFITKSGMGLPSPSPFCMKVEILLQMAGLEYECQVSSNPREGPKGKLPFIEDDGQTIGDSALIQAHLENKYGADFDHGLGLRDKGIAHAVARMVEERLYWVMVYDRWINDSNWHETSSFWFGDLPPVLRSIAPVMARKQVRGDLYSHGIGRHEPSEIYEFGRKDVDALANLLGTERFMMSDKPCSLDAAAFPVLASIATNAVQGEPWRCVQAHANLIDYIQRCTELWFPEFIQSGEALSEAS